jgi:hypothetical protein
MLRNTLCSQLVNHLAHIVAVGMQDGVIGIGFQPAERLLCVCRQCPACLIERLTLKFIREPVRKQQRGVIVVNRNVEVLETTFIELVSANTIDFALLFIS